MVHERVSNAGDEPPIGPSARGETGVVGAPTVLPIKRHPPTSPGPVEGTDEGKLWPNLVGIAVIVLQGLGLLVSVAYALSLLIDYQKLMGAFASSDTFAATEKWKSQLFASYGSAALLAVLAIVGGSFVLLRRRMGSRLLVAWSLLRLPYAVWASLINAIVQRDTAAAMGGFTAGPPGAAGMANMADMMFWMTFATGMAFSLALPLFLLIWFHVPRIRRQVRLWR